MQITTRFFHCLILLCLILPTLGAGNPITPEKNNNWFSPPPGCELPAPGNVTVVSVGPDFANLDWDDVPGAIAYQAVLTDLSVSPSVSVSTTVTSSNISYNSTLITPGHNYKFEVASICANNQVGEYSASVTFNAPVIIVVIDIVTRQCTPSQLAGPGLQWLPNSAGNMPGIPKSFDLVYNGATFGFEAQAMPDGNVRFDVNSGSSFYAYCVVYNTAGCSNIDIRINGNNGNPVTLATFSALTLDYARYLNVNFLQNGVTFKTCPTGRGLAKAGEDDGMLGQQSSDVPQAADEMLRQSSDPTRLQVAPNPFTQTLNLRFHLPQPSNAPLLSVCDMNGRVVHQETLGTQLVPGDYTHTLLLDALDAGVYVLTLTTEHGVFSHRILKQ